MTHKTEQILTHPPARNFSKLRGYAFVILAPLLWAGNFVIGRALVGIDPFVLNFARWLVAGVCLMPLMLFQTGNIMRALRERGAALLGLSILGIVGFNTLLYTGLETTGAGLAGVVFGLTPLFINVLSVMWGQKSISRRMWIGTGIAFTGVVLVLSDRSHSGASGGTGLIFVFLSSFVFALYTVGLKSLRIPLRSDVCLGVTIWLGLAVMTPFAMNQTDAWHTMLQSQGIFPALGYLGVGASVFAFYAWQTGVRIHGPQRAGAFLQLIPIFGVLLGIVLLNEHASIRKVLSLVIVVTGVLLVQRGDSS